MSSFVYKKIKATGIKLQIVTTSCWQCLVENITMSKLQKEAKYNNSGKVAKFLKSLWWITLCRSGRALQCGRAPTWLHLLSCEIMCWSYKRDYVLVIKIKNGEIKVRLCVRLSKNWRDQVRLCFELKWNTLGGLWVFYVLYASTKEAGYLLFRKRYSCIEQHLMLDNSEWKCDESCSERRKNCNKRRSWYRSYQDFW